MTHYELEPEVPGNVFGKNTEYEFDNNKNIIVKKLQFVFDGWMGDDLITSDPCFLISSPLKEELLKHPTLTGFEIEDCLIEKSDFFNELYPNKFIPEFYWLKINGKNDLCDFWLKKNAYLCVSIRAFDIISKFNINYCDIVKVD